jgi:hypothetical protein
MLEDQDSEIFPKSIDVGFNEEADSEFRNSNRFSRNSFDTV